MVTNNKEYMREYQRKRLGCKKVYNTNREKQDGERNVYTKSKKILCDVCNLYTLEGNIQKHKQSRQHQEKLQVLHQLRIELGIIVENDIDIVQNEIDNVNEIENDNNNILPSYISLKPLNNIFK